MRNFLDAILAFIESESLTDSEFAGISLSVQEYSKAVYDALRAVLESRENVSGQTKRLNQYFVARGVDLSAANATPTANSHILIGCDLG